MKGENNILANNIKQLELIKHAPFEKAKRKDGNLHGRQKQKDGYPDSYHYRHTDDALECRHSFGVIELRRT